MKCTDSDRRGLLLDILYSEDLTEIENRITELDTNPNEVLRYARRVNWTIEDHIDDLDAKINELQSDRRDSEKRTQWLKNFINRLEDEKHDEKD